jgi:hypothetical protein
MTSEPEHTELIVKVDGVEAGPGAPCPACGALANEPCFPDCLSYVEPDRPEQT